VVYPPVRNGAGAGVGSHLRGATWICCIALECRRSTAKISIYLLSGWTTGSTLPSAGIRLSRGDTGIDMNFLRRYGFRLSLLLILLLTWGWSAWRPLHPDDWLLENYLVFFWVPLLLLTARFFRLSDIAYGLITLFLCLHVIGSHYTYSEVPFGYALQDWMGAGRNMYDRFVHLCYGLLLAYPIREVLLRFAGLRGFWGYFFPVDVTFALSSIYEIIEWLAATVAAPEVGLAFLGTQGDVWDAQKDMLLAGTGAILAMVIVFLLNLWLEPGTVREVRSSLRVPTGDHPLGETSLEHWLEEDSREP
jgi:putative membrane protein